jgi:beta-lactamase class A
MLEVLAVVAFAAVAPPPPTPIEARIAARLRSFAGKMGVAAIHLDTGETIAVAADERFPTASAIKTAVMVELFHQIDAAGLKGAIRVDSGIVTTRTGRYVVAIFARRAKDTRWTVDNDALVTGAEVSRIVFDHFSKAVIPR